MYLYIYILYIDIVYIYTVYIYSYPTVSHCIRNADSSGYKFSTSMPQGWRPMNVSRHRQLGSTTGAFAQACLGLGLRWEFSIKDRDFANKNVE